MATKETVKNVSNGMGVLGWLFIVLFVLKLNPGGHLDSPVQDLSWWWVTAPLWGPLALVLAILAVVGISMLFLAIGGKRNGR